MQYLPQVEQLIREGYTDAEILAMHPEVDASALDELRHAMEGTA